MANHSPRSLHRLPVGQQWARSCPAQPRTSRSNLQLCRLTQLVAEVLAGQRPAAQMRPLLSRQAYHLLWRRAGIYACTRRPRVRNTHLVSDYPDVTEVIALVSDGRRYRALALRVTFTESSWVCTHIETDAERRGG
ncbi:hypothetical protein FHX37_1497 [Haloactinospora alba]|uniref:Uncharacterized protein n=1 Tax=Haloactinospora alba TaxID=405555 RepID=A0A543NIC4_9ACTN|nr:Rv3235 family protein [Haloactinospora alba]TQN31589.1 hypothetical protein FHX37_1497 [Haloactinospora alba]